MSIKKDEFKEMVAVEINKFINYLVTGYIEPSEKKEIINLGKMYMQKHFKIDENRFRIIELEDKACGECWEYCYENGFTDEEQDEYDKLVYAED